MGIITKLGVPPAAGSLRVLVPQGLTSWPRLKDHFFNYASRQRRTKRVTLFEYSLRSLGSQVLHLWSLVCGGELPPKSSNPAKTVRVAHNQGSRAHPTS